MMIRPFCDLLGKNIEHQEGQVAYNEFVKNEHKN
jgi:hypothetical protein